MCCRSSTSKVACVTGTSRRRARPMRFCWTRTLWRVSLRDICRIESVSGGLTPCIDVRCFCALRGSVAYQSPLFIREHSKRLLRAALWNDSLFLSDMNGKFALSSAGVGSLCGCRHIPYSSFFSRSIRSHGLFSRRGTGQAQS